VTRPEDVAHNRALWDQVSAEISAADGLSRWAADEIAWGLSGVPESQVGVLGQVRNRDVVELGCGVAHLSAQLVRRGARAVALDLSSAQLSATVRAQGAHGPWFPVLQADAERLPLADRCADLVVSEHGVAAWCEPQAWVAEAARILRPGGRLVFLTNSPLSAMCVPAEGGPAGQGLLRGPAELREIRWPGGGLEHHPTHGDWIRVLGRNGFTVTGLRELPDPSDGTADEERTRTASGLYGIADPEWAERWPVEDLWTARRLPDPAE
jgi:SAM-dependent methyltransferase